jgi:peptide/nickel transport system permease protein
LTIGRWRPLHGITGFVVRRVLLGFVTLFVVSVLVFAATQALPGDAARAILGKNATPESLAALREQLGLGEPILQQYWHWLGGLVRGDLGDSLVAGEAVTTIIGERLIRSVLLVVAAALVSIPLAVLLGVACARRRDGLLDRSVSLLLLAFAALPEFVIGIALVVAFGTTVTQVLPPVSLIPPGESIFHHVDELVLPVATLAIVATPYIALIMRASMIEILESDYIEMARLKGVTERKVVWRHAVPNAIAPTVQVAALTLAWLAGGIVAVEYVFTYPGIGTALVDGVQNRDVPAVQALAMLVAAVYVALNVIADVVAILVSPRLRTSLS